MGRVEQLRVQALTIQAGIPIFWLVASGIYTAAQFGFIHGPIPENITFRLMDCIPMVSPIVTMIYIQAYRSSRPRFTQKISTFREGLIKLFYKASGANFFIPNAIGSSVVDVSFKVIVYFYLDVSR